MCSDVLELGAAALRAFAISSALGTGKRKSSPLLTPPAAAHTPYIAQYVRRIAGWALSAASSALASSRHSKKSASGMRIILVCS